MSFHAFTFTWKNLTFCVLFSGEDSDEDLVIIHIVLISSALNQTILSI